MSKSVRIRTTPNGEDKYVKVELKQDFDLLEILSLKIKQSDVYGNFCSNHGVVAGRVIINNGFGVPNVKVSIFIPKNSDNPIVEQLYPYDSPNPDKKNVNGIRYNLLPDTQQKLSHTPVGTFPDKISILDDKTNLEIYERYYKYTTTTNESGDFILFGVPTGNQILHYDMDVSDIGFISARPYELIEQGIPKEQFQSPFKYKSSRNLDSLTQIISANINIQVEPFWCDSLSTGRVLGITRKDISIDSLELIPTAMFFGSVISDDERDSVNKNCRPRKKMGQMNEMITGGGQVEAVYRTIDGDIEKYDVPQDAIDDNGTFAMQLPMNLRKVVTDEFGNLIPSPDGIKGIATEADFRFRVSMDATSQDKRIRQRANYLVPNLTGNYKFDNYDLEEMQEEQPYQINQQLSTLTQNTPYSADTTNQYNYLEDFYTLRWKKVYTVKQYIGRYQSNKRDRNRNFIGIKRILDGAGVNKFPISRLFTKINPIYTILCVLLQFIAIVVAFINGVLNIINGLVTAICNVTMICGIKIQVSNFSGNFSNPCIADFEFTLLNWAPTLNIVKRTIQLFSIYLKLKVCFKRKCLFAGFLCKKCDNVCAPNNPAQQHTCMKDDNGNNISATACDNLSNKQCRKLNECTEMVPAAGAEDPVTGEEIFCCSKCCGKVNLISLKCPEETGSGPYRPSCIRSPFASSQCNDTYVELFSCKECSGWTTPQIRDWVACKLEGVANFLNMLQFEFYNDWVSGTLYYPLIKRKYKVRKRKKGRGDVRKDKFCDFDCAPDYQQPLTYTRYRIIVKNNTTSKSTDITVDGCKVKFRGSYRYVTKWYGDYVTNQNASAAQSLALDSAKEELKFSGRFTDTGYGCTLRFSDLAVQQALQNNSRITIRMNDNKTTKEFPGIHGKPKYIKVEDPITGINGWENVGGHAHHQNKCNTVYKVEKEEYFRDSIGCLPNNVDDTNNNPDGNAFETQDGPPEEGQYVINPNSPCPDTGCSSPCSSGVQGCTNQCKCYGHEPYNDRNIKHGIVKWEDGNIYYASIIKKGDPAFNETTNGEFYKANLMFPTDLVEMGSSVNCDVDDVPFIIGELEPTTSKVSEEGLKYKMTGLNPKTITEVEDKDGVLNLRAYVSFGCAKINCLNTTAGVVQSQIGVDLIDDNDLGMEIQPCFTYYDHDDQIRDYFCRRFSTYTDNNLNINYMRPNGSNEFDNLYETYPTVTLASNTQFIIDNVTYPETINDGDEFITGDRCGLKNNGQYFYGAGWNGNTPDTLLKFPTEADIDNKSIPNKYGVMYSTSQTPYYNYFGLVPGKTALHRLVSLYFADIISEVTLQGLGNNENAAQNTYNQPNFRNIEQNKFTVLRSCLGEAQIASATETSAANDVSIVVGNNLVNKGVGAGGGVSAPAPPLTDYTVNGITTVGNTNLYSTNQTNNVGQISPTTITVTSVPAQLKVEIFGGSTPSFGPSMGGGTFNIYDNGTSNPVSTSVISQYGQTSSLGAGGQAISNDGNNQAVVANENETITYSFNILQIGTYNVYMSYSSLGNNNDGFMKIS